MNDLPLAIADLAALAIVFLSGMLAYVRGALREFFFLATWGGAIAAMIYLYDLTLPLAVAWIGGDPLLAALANGAGLFVIALTAMSLLSSAIVARRGDAGLNVLDRSLGFVFGLVRGALMVCLVYLLYTLLAPIAEHPRWLREAKLTPLAAEGAEIMLALLPEEWGLKGERVARQLKESSAAIEPLVGYGDLIAPLPAAPEAGEEGGEHGYGSEQRHALEEMIEAEE